MQNRSIQAGFSIVCMLAVTAVHSGALSAQDSLVEKIRSGQDTLSQAEQELSMLKHQGALDSRQILDYEAWMQQLQIGLEQDCRQLYRTAQAPLPTDLPCDSRVLSATGAADIDTIGEHTREEAVVDLDNHLRRSLGEFDEKLLREQQRVKAGKPDSSSATATGTGTASSGDSSAEQVGVDDGEQATSGEQARSKDTGTGEPGHTGISSAPAGTPDGSDDDVVARQLREAAETEPDPELKRKLWEEYKKYKQGIQ
jgi:hypothetical protein